MHLKVSLLPAPDAEPDRYTKRCTAALGFSLVCKIEYPDFVVLELLDTLLSDLYILWIVVMGSVQRIVQRQQIFFVIKDFAKDGIFISAANSDAGKQRKKMPG